MYSTDKRWKQLGELLVGYSTNVKAGERVMIAMGELESYPLVHAVYEAAIRAGAFPQVQFLSETFRRSLLLYGSDEQLRWVPEIEAYGMEWADVYLGLRGGHNLHEHWDAPAHRLALTQAAMGKISSLRWHKTRGCVVRIPDADFAQQAERDLETITDMFFNACLIDWEAEAARWRTWADSLNHASQVRLVGKESDLSFSVADRRWVVGDGRINMPDGELTTAPVTETLEGQIYFERPATLGGRAVSDVRLQWHQGRLTRASAATNEAYLHSIINTDPGASVLGEFALGTNPSLRHFCQDILFDEKIGGTVHVALGRAYPECGGTNQSAIHWDIVKDIRQEGAVYVDGQVILQNGTFLLP